MSDDAALVERTLAGELTAFEVLVDRHRPVVERVAARIVGEHDAEDVVQDSFLRAFHTLAGFRGEAAFKTWLLTITRNAALNVLAKRRDVSLGDEDEPDQLSPGGPALSLEDRERRDRIRLKLRELRPAHRSVLVCETWKG